MQNRFILYVVLLYALTAASCSSLKAPARPVYTGVDGVTAATEAQLIGIWSVSELNPYTDSDPQTTTIEYREDGTVKGTITTVDQNTDALGSMEFILSGSWSLNADIVTHHNITMSTSSNSALAELISEVVNNRPAVSTQANIYELTDSTIVMVGSDGSAMKYVRQ